MPELKLPEVLDQRGAQTVSAQLLSQLGQDMILDASGIRRLGAVGVEMLIAAHHQWEQDGTAFEIRNWSQDALKALSILGVTPQAFAMEGQ